MTLLKGFRHIVLYGLILATNLYFKMEVKSMSETQLVFENLKHDFPQIISYTKVTSDSLVAEISGTKNGQKQIFPMKQMQ